MDFRLFLEFFTTFWQETTYHSTYDSTEERFVRPFWWWRVQEAVLSDEVYRNEAVETFYSSLTALIIHPFYISFLFLHKTLMARNGLLCADVPLRNYPLTHPARYTSGLCSASKFPIFIDICRPIFYTTITTSACWRLIVYNHNNWRHQLRDRPRSRPCKPIGYGCRHTH